MITFQASKNMLSLQQTVRHRILSIPVFTALWWLCLQKGCAWNPDISPAHIVVAHDTVVTEQHPSTSWLSREVPTLDRPAGQLLALVAVEQHSTNQSLQQASALLREAAALLDKNDRKATRLILEAITILKYEIMRDADGPHHDRISSSPFSSDPDTLQGDRASPPSFIDRHISQDASPLRPDDSMHTTLSPRSDRPTDD